MGRDFFDDDLVKKREKTPEIHMGPADEVDPIETPPANVSDLNLTRMAQHRERVEEQVAAAAHELEKLRQRQQDIEHEKRQLEDLRKKQSDFTGARHEMLEHLGSSLVRLEKDEIKSQQLLELLAAARREFRENLAEIETMNEDEWAPDDLQDELNRALTTLEDARMSYNRTMAKIEAVSSSEKATGKAEPVSFEHRTSHHERSFGEWMVIGLAVSLPMLLALVCLVILYYLQTIGAL
ncbi:MAG: hypothetical protein KJ626_05475 [Verrucomicrobia bacterium]|nr:hypothetical protein [Verrucomicrobiota bacterium]